MCFSLDQTMFPLILWENNLKRLLSKFNIKNKRLENIEIIDQS